MKFLRIKSFWINVLACVFLVFISAILILSEWYFKENRLSPITFNVISLLIIVLYSVFYINLLINVIVRIKDDTDEILMKIGLVIYFFIQTFFSIQIVGLLLILLGIDLD